MESIPEHRLLKQPPGSLENIRKIHNLNETGRLEEAIKILEEWIQKEDHIIKKDFGKDYLEKTLISCKGSVEKSKTLIDRLCTMKTMMPKFFSKVNAKEELKEILELAWVTPLPIITEDYCRVLIVKINNKNFTTESYMKYYQYHIILVEYIKAHDYVNGFVVIIDFSEINLIEVMSKMNAVELQQFLTILIKGYSARLKKILMLTDSKAIELLVKTVKHIVSEKIGSRIHVQPNLEELHKVVPKEILPVEYGGTERSIKKLQEEWVEAISSEEHVEYMKMMNKACSDETKRQAVKFNEDYMGLPGSFRGLKVD